MTPKSLKRLIHKKLSKKRAHDGCLGSRSEEGRGKLRKATRSCKRAKNRRCPNGETPLNESLKI